MLRNSSLAGSIDPTVARITVTSVDGAWPVGFRDLAPRSLPPAESLRVEGALPPPGARAVAIVGTRHADEEAFAFTRELAADAARGGFVVVSGGARGIDAAAHEGALDAGGKTVVVFGAGLDCPYPDENASLFERVRGGGGAVVSEQPDHVAPHAGLFLARNRLVAAWAEVVVVVQAPARSGALSTARLATTLKRAVFAVPASPWDPRGGGCLALLRRGAAVCASWGDVSGRGRSRSRAAGSGDALFGAAPPKEAAVEGLSREAAAILAVLGGRPRQVDDVVRAVHLPAPRVLALLLELELAGWVEARGPGLFGTNPARRRAAGEIDR